MKKKFLFLMILFMLISFVGCSEGSSKSEVTNNPSSIVSSGDGIIDANGIEITDVFNELKFNEIEIKDITQIEISVNDILVHTINVNGIENLDIEVTTINDEFVYLAYQNIINYYEADIDVDQLIKDLVIAGGCIILCVTLSTVAGPVGTFFGAVMCSEFTVGAGVVGAAIDAAVAGVQAYQEGGDFSYIMGHILQGVVDGIKWGAILAPITGVTSGIKAIKAVKTVTQIPGFEKYTYKQISSMFDNFEEVVSVSRKLAKNSNDTAIQKVFNENISKFSSDITEEVFNTMVKNKDVLFNVIKKYNPMNVLSSVVKQYKNNLIDDALEKGIDLNSLIRQIQSGKITSFDSLIKENELVEDFLKNQDLDRFINLFGDKFNQQFTESMINKFVGVSSDNLKKAFASKNPYTYLLSSIDSSVLNKKLEDYTSLLLLQMKFGSKNLNKLINYGSLYRNIVKDNVISIDVVEKIVDGFFDGTIKSLDDIAKINKQASKNISDAPEIFSILFKELNISKKMGSLLDDMASIHLAKKFRSDAFEGNVSKTIKDIISNSLSKTDIISKYGAKVYNEFVDKINYSLDTISITNKNDKLIQEIFDDFLKDKNISEESKRLIKTGARCEQWGLTKELYEEVNSAVGAFYKFTDEKMYTNYIYDIAEIRCQKAKTLISEQNLTIRNSQYASKIAPPPNEYIAKKYGDIRYNSAGFPIFDEYAAAEVKISDLTGDSISDINKANKIHHGDYTNPKGYTWHHLEDGETLILIPTELHEAYRHTGGADLIRDGIKEVV